MKRGNTGQRYAERRDQEFERQRKEELTVGDLLELDPAAAREAGLNDAADAIEKAQGLVRIGAPNTDNASPFGSEWGQQMADRVRTIPLQRSGGAFGMNVPGAEKRLSELYFLKNARDAGLGRLNEMTPEQYQELTARSQEQAQRKVASIMEVHEQAGNALAPIDIDKTVEDTVRAKNLPAWVYATPFGLQALAAHGREKIEGTPTQDQPWTQFMAPFLALSRPGFQEDQKTGRPATTREGKMWWMFRLAPSTAVGSWLLDKNASWELGGEMGWGSKHHVEKILRGYDLVSDMPRVAELYEQVRPGDAGPIEETIAAALPIGATILLEPDAISVGTGLIMAPAGKLAKEYGLGIKVMEKVAGPALDEWKAMAAEGKGLAEIAETVGAKGTFKRLLFDSIAGDVIANIGRAAAEKIGDKGAQLGKVAQLDPVAARNLPQLAEESAKELEDTRTALEALAQKVEGLASEADSREAAELAALAKNAIDARLRRASLEEATVGSALIRGAVDSAKPGDLLYDRTTGEMVRLVSRNVQRVPLRTGSVAQPGVALTDELNELRAARSALYDEYRKVFEYRHRKPKVGTSPPAAMEYGLAMRLLEHDKLVKELEKKAASFTGPAPRVIQRLTVQLPDGTTKSFSPTRFQRVASPARRSDVQLVMKELSSLKARSDKTIDEIAKAKAIGDDTRVMVLSKKLAGYRGRMVANLTDMSFQAIESAFRKASDDMIEANNAYERVRATREFSDPRIAEALVELEGYTAKLDQLLGKESRLARQYKAMEGAQDTLVNVLDQYGSSFKKLAGATRAGTAEAAEMGRPVLADYTKQVGDQFEFNGPAYKAALHAKYGTEAVDAALRSPSGQAVAESLERSFKMPVRGMDYLTEFERGVHATAESTRITELERAAKVMRTAGEFRFGLRLDREGMMMRGYQLAQSLNRATDWVGGTAIGRAPRVIRETIRRGFERFTMMENDFGTISKTHGIDGVRDYLTSTKPFEGAVGNRDMLAPADKALQYLRAIAKGEVWAEDPVVEALSNAPLPSGFAARMTDRYAAAGLQRLVGDPATTGAELVRYVEESITGLYASQLGKADLPQVVFRFMARAIGFGAAQHDTLYDLVRATGEGIDANAARALNWLNVPEKGTFAAHDVDAAYRASAAFGTPKLSKQRGALQNLFKAKDVETDLFHLGELEGKDFYIPRALWEAMKEVPRDLAKEMKEFNTPPTYLTNMVDRISRLWRVTVVNGYVMPRAAYFVNAFAGDFGQMITTLGAKEAVRQAVQTAPAYVPFVGPRLQNALFEYASRGSVLSALFDPTIRKVMTGADDVIVALPTGPISARKLMQEAREDGCFDSISTRDLLEITRRGQKSWDPLGVPKHIELTARFMETIQSRNRLGVYVRQRQLGATRRQARDRLVEALYDWKTGIPTWEHQMIGRLAVFWSYRRNMLRQLGAALTEGVSNPEVQFGWKAWTGNTKIGRTMKLGRLLTSLPNMVYWTDPNEYLEDEEQLHELGMRVAPWWVTSQPFLGNREVSKARELWYSEVAGRSVNYETLMLPAVTTLDQLYLLNLFLQNGMATTVALSEKAGLSPNLTTVQGAELAERNISAFTDMLAPGLDEFMKNALRASLTGEGTEQSPRGVPVPKAQAVMLRRLGWDDFMAAAPDADGQIRIDSNAYGLLTSLVLSLPPIRDLASNWTIFADNPGYNESLSTGLLEALSSWTGVLRPQGHDPFRSMDFESAEKERRLKDELSSAKKRAFPRDAIAH